MSELPRVITTEQLRQHHDRLPALAPGVAASLHPHGVHVIFDLCAFGDVGPSDEVTPCTVLAVTRTGEVLRLAHYLADSVLADLPTLDTMVASHAELVQADVERTAVGELETWLRDAAEGIQQRLPFTEID